MVLFQMTRFYWDHTAPEVCNKAPLVFFGRGIQGIHCLLRSVNNFIQCPTSEFMAIVTEVFKYDCDDIPARSNTWLFAKFGEPTQICLLGLVHPSPCIHLLNNKQCLKKQLFAIIGQKWCTVVPLNCPSRNIVFYN